LAYIKLRKEGLAKLRRLSPQMSDSQLSRKAEIHATQLHRLLNDDTQPGMRTIAGLCQVFGKEWFGELFDVISDDDK
jgi:transcriptional regulator with XRE-family HTH domain